MLLIFDCDGVLRPFHWEGAYEAYQEIVRFAGRDPGELFGNLPEFKTWINTDWQVNMKNIGGIEPSDFPEIGRIFHSIYDPYIRIFPWVEEVFEELSQRHTIVVFSGSFSKSIKKSLNSSSQHVSLIIGADNVSRLKPEPEGIYVAMRKYSADHRDTLMIGDSEADMMAGNNAGIKIGAVDWGMRRISDFLVDFDPHHVFHSPNDLLCI